MPPVVDEALDALQFLAFFPRGSAKVPIPRPKPSNFAFFYPPPRIEQAFFDPDSFLSMPGFCRNPVKRNLCHFLGTKKSLYTAEFGLFWPGRPFSFLCPSYPVFRHSFFEKKELFAYDGGQDAYLLYGTFHLKRKRAGIEARRHAGNIK